MRAAHKLLEVACLRAMNFPLGGDSTVSLRAQPAL
jgi:hypothetical protein